MKKEIDDMFTQTPFDREFFADKSKQTFTKNEVDFAYLTGVFNVSGIDGLHKELERLKSLKKDPSDLIISCRNS